MDFFVSSVASTFIPGWLVDTVGWAFNTVVFFEAEVMVPFVADLDALSVVFLVEFVSFGTDGDTFVVFFFESVPANTFLGPGFKGGVGRTDVFGNAFVVISSLVSSSALAFVGIMVEVFVLGAFQDAVSVIVSHEALFARAGPLIVVENFVLSTFRDAVSISISVETIFTDTSPLFVVENFVFSAVGDTFSMRISFESFLAFTPVG